MLFILAYICLLAVRVRVCVFVCLWPRIKN